MCLRKTLPLKFTHTEAPLSDYHTQCSMRCDFFEENSGFRNFCFSDCITKFVWVGFVMRALVEITFILINLAASQEFIIRTNLNTKFQNQDCSD